MKKIITICILLFGAMAVNAQNLKPFKFDNGKYGYKDEKGNIVVRPIYSEASAFSEGLAAVSLEKGGIVRWGFIDGKGKVVIPFKWGGNAGDFHDGLAVVTEGFYLDKPTLWGAIDKTGKLVIPLAYTYLSDFKNGKADAELNGKKFFIDKTGKEVK